MMSKNLLIVLGFLFVWGGCAPSGSSSSGGDGEQRVLQTDARVQGLSILAGLQNAWDVALTADGGMLYTERCRGVSVRTSEGEHRLLFGGRGAVMDTGDSLCDDNTGFLGIAVHPAFKYNRTIYVFMLSEFNNREHVVARFKVNSDYTQVTDRVDIVTGLPYKKVANSWGGAGAHSGGRLRFGSDGNLYISVGDSHEANSQDLNSLGGKIMVVTDDGGVVKDLSHFSGDPRIYATGLRQVLGMTFNQAKVIACDSSPVGGEVIRIGAGENAGWDARPIGGATCADNYCGDRVRARSESSSMTSFASGSRISSCEMITGDAWGELNGMMLMSSESVPSLEIINPENLESVGALSLPQAVIRSVVQAEGDIYIVTESEIWKLRPKSPAP